MNTFNKHYKEIEHNQIEMTLSHIRIASPKTLNKMITSIDAHGQLSPVIVVPAVALNRFTLMDGYLRVLAMKKLRHDIVKAEVWECGEAEALLVLLANQGQRSWEAFEEAQALRELQIRYHLSQEQIAKRIGRSRSWISYRLALLDELSDQFIEAVTQGKISLWSAQRVLVPVARATAKHGESLLNYLNKNSHHSTRELSEFYEHYKKSNKTTREKMILELDLFFKAQKTKESEKEAALLKRGPEGEWQWRFANICDQIKYLEKLIPQLFYDHQEEKACHQLLLPLERVQNDLNQILIKSRRQHDRQNETSNHHYLTPIRQERQAH